MTMRNFLTATLAAVACIAVIGCAREPEPLAEPPEGEQRAATQDATSQGGSDGIGITSPAAGGVSPVTGSESVGGAGGGSVGSVAKERAKDVAASSSSSVDQYDFE